MSHDKQKEKIKIPKDLFKSMLEAHQQWEEVMDELEDYVLTHDPEWIEKLKQAKKSHEEGSFLDMEEMKQDLGLD